jgi:Tfp pilus assembly protein PilN
MRAINLLPQKAKERAVQRRRQAVLVVLVLAFLGLLAAAVVWQEGEVGKARDELEVQQAEVTRLESEIAELRDLEQIKASFDSRAALIGQILQTDIAWGRLLNDFGRLIPPRVWLTSFTASTITTEGDPSLGLIQVSGTAFDYTDVASWLRVLDSSSFPGVDSTWVATASSSVVGDAPVVDFSSSTALTSGARSDRFERLIPEVP